MNWLIIRILLRSGIVSVFVLAAMVTPVSAQTPGSEATSQPVQTDSNQTDDNTDAAETTNPVDQQDPEAVASPSDANVPTDPSAEPPADEPAAESAEKPPADDAGAGSGGQTSTPKSNDDALRAAVANAVDQPAEAAATGDPQLRFRFSRQPWEDVLLWLSEESDLQLQMNQPPAGTLSFIDPTRAYTPNEAVDLINRLLLDKGYALVRRGRLLILVDLEDELAPKLIRELAQSIKSEELDSRSGSDIVRCIFPLGGVSPDTAAEELGELVGPWGSVIVLESSRQVIVVETVEKLKAIREALRQANGPGGVGGDVVAIPLQHRTPDEVLSVARQLMGLDEEDSSAEGIQIATDLFGANLFAAGESAKLSQFRAIVELVDKPLDLEEGEEQKAPEPPYLQRYPLSAVAIETAFDVLSTMLAGLPEVRMSTEANTSSIILWARPDEQKMVKDTIDMLEGKGLAFEVIQLNRLDPQAAVLTINKFFERGEDGAGTGPTVDGDPTSGKLWIKGTPTQVQLVRDLIDQMEGSSQDGLLDDRVRLLPFTGRTAQSALQQLEMLWGVTGRSNRIRFSTPSKSEAAPVPERRIQRPGDSAPAADQPDSDQPDSDQPPATTPSARDLQTRLGAPGKFRWASDRVLMTQTVQTPEAKPGQGADIVISMTPGGMVIASEDTEALDQFESLFRSLAEQTAGAGDTPTVFWLKFAKAEDAGELLNSILTGTSGSAGGLGDIAGDMLGELGGGMLGMLGMGSGASTGGGEGPIFTTSGVVSIVTDARLNALIVQANATDLQLVEDLLSVIDREQSPETVETEGKTYLIPVQYQEAGEIVDVVKSVFSDQMEQPQQGGGRGGGQPNPAELIAALRGGGRGGGRGGAGGGGQQIDVVKMSLATDAKNNIIILKGTPQHYQQVQELVSGLDIRGPDTEESVQVVSLGGSINPEIVQQALLAVLGPQAKAGTTTASNTSSGSSNSQSSDASSSSQSDAAAAAARRAAIFSQLRGGGAVGGGFRGAQPGGGGQPGGGRGGFGGQPGGGRSRGGR